MPTAIPPRLFRFLAAAALARAATASMTTATGVKFNITLTPLDPALDPNPTGDDHSTWSFTAASSNTSDADASGKPVSSATVYGPGSSNAPPQVAISFQGESYYLYGKAHDGATASDMRLVLDGSDVSGNAPTGSLLASAPDLNWTAHTAVFSALNGDWMVDRAVLTTGMVTQAPTFEDVTITGVPFAVDDQLNRWFNWTGNWTTLDALPGSDAQSSFVHASGNAGAQVTFAVPANTSYIVINGTTGPEHGPITITMSPQLDRAGYSFENTVNASRPFRSTGRLAFVQLKPDELYTAKLATSNGAGHTGAGLHDVTFYSAFSTVKREAKSSSGVSKNTIIGAAVGGGVGLLLLLALLLFFCFCYRRRSSEPAHKPGSLDTTPAASDEQGAVGPEPHSPQWYADKYAPFPQPPHHSPPFAPRLSLEDPALHPRPLMMEGLHGFDAQPQPLMGTEVLAHGHNAAPAATGATAPHASISTIHLDPGYGGSPPQPHNGLLYAPPPHVFDRAHASPSPSGTVRDAPPHPYATHLSVTNPDPSPRPSMETPRLTAQGYADSLLVGARNTETPTPAHAPVPDTHAPPLPVHEQTGAYATATHDEPESVSRAQSPTPEPYAGLNPTHMRLPPVMFGLPVNDTEQHGIGRAV